MYMELAKGWGWQWTHTAVEGDGVQKSKTFESGFTLYQATWLSFALKWTTTRCSGMHFTLRTLRRIWIIVTYSTCTRNCLLKQEGNLLEKEIGSKTRPLSSKQTVIRSCGVEILHQPCETVSDSPVYIPGDADKGCILRVGCTPPSLAGTVFSAFARQWFFLSLVWRFTVVRDIRFEPINDKVLESSPCWLNKLSMLPSKKFRAEHFLSPVYVVAWHVACSLKQTLLLISCLYMLPFLISRKLHRSSHHVWYDDMRE